MTSGGLLWFTDLTLPDPYYVLPVAAGLSLLAILELNLHFRRSTMPVR